MNPHAAQPVSPASLLGGFWTHRELIVQMARREVAARYQGSVAGVVWALLTPLTMLLLYTFVFSVVFQARWGGQDGSRTQFAVLLFAGLTVHTLFADVINRAPGLVLAHANYVKKVVFPLETLVPIALGSALFHAAVSLLVLALAILALPGLHLPWTAVFAPLVVLPLAVLALGVGWLLASIGVFVRDLGQVVGLLTSVLLFASPVFFPADAVPERWRGLLAMNPLSLIIEQLRAVLIWGSLPRWGALALHLAVSSFVAWLGYAWFQKTRKGFADVL